LRGHSQSQRHQAGAGVVHIVGGGGRRVVAQQAGKAYAGDGRCGGGAGCRADRVGDGGHGMRIDLAGDGHGRARVGRVGVCRAHWRGGGGSHGQQRRAGVAKVHIVGGGGRRVVVQIAGGAGAGDGRCGRGAVCRTVRARNGGHGMCIDLAGNGHARAGFGQLGVGRTYRRGRRAPKGQRYGAGAGQPHIVGRRGRRVVAQLTADAHAGDAGRGGGAGRRAGRVGDGGHGVGVDLASDGHVIVRFGQAGAGRAHRRGGRAAEGQLHDAGTAEVHIVGGLGRGVTTHTTAGARAGDTGRRRGEIRRTARAGNGGHGMRIHFASDGHGIGRACRVGIGGAHRRSGRALDGQRHGTGAAEVHIVGGRSRRVAAQRTTGAAGAGDVGRRRGAIWRTSRAGNGGYGVGIDRAGDGHAIGGARQAGVGRTHRGNRGAPDGQRYGAGAAEVHVVGGCGCRVVAQTAAGAAGAGDVGSSDGSPVRRASRAGDGGYGVRIDRTGDGHAIGGACQVGVGRAHRGNRGAPDGQRYGAGAAEVHVIGGSSRRVVAQTAARAASTGDGGSSGAGPTRWASRAGNGGHGVGIDRAMDGHAIGSARQVGICRANRRSGRAPDGQRHDAGT